MRTSENDPILLCYDDSVGARRAIEAAGALFPGRNAIVLHIWSPVAAIGAAYGARIPSAAFDEGEIQRSAMLLAEEGARLATDSGLQAAPAIASARFDGTSNTILSFAELRGVGVIVLGARGLSAVRSLLLGSVSHAVVQHAHCPVLVIPPAQHAEAVMAPIGAERAVAVAPPGIVLGEIAS